MHCARALRLHYIIIIVHTYVYILYSSKVLINLTRIMDVPKKFHIVCYNFGSNKLYVENAKKD